MIFFIVMNQVFGNLSAVDLFISQKAILLDIFIIQERSTGRHCSEKSELG